MNTSRTTIIPKQVKDIEILIQDNHQKWNKLLFCGDLLLSELLLQFFKTEHLLNTPLIFPVIYLHKKGKGMGEHVMS